MFKNIGKKIKGLAKVIFIISLVICGIYALIAAIYVGKAAALNCGGISVTSYGYTHSDNGAAGFFAGLGVFILIAGVGFVMSWISSFFMYGFGQLIDDSEINRKTNQEILARLNPAPAAPVVPEAPAVPEQPAAPETPVPAGWVCANCGAKNKEESVFCSNCGTKKE